MKLCLVFLNFLFFGNLLSQSIDKAKLDAYFDVLEKNNKYMGSVAVSKNGKIIYAKSIGFADVENQIKASEKSKYHIGSISKTFTATLILKAVESHLLKLDQTIGTYFPEIKDADKISIDQLLHHRSGIHNFTDAADYESWAYQPQNEKQLVAKIAKYNADFEPDSKAEYSNSNYVLLSYILEKLYKKSYAELLEKYITQPLELKDTYSGKKINVSAGDCKSYYYEGSWKVEKETDPSVPIGAGAVVATPSDILKFADALFHNKIIGSESLDLMKNMKDGYGMALFPMPFNDKKGFGHTGSIDGFSSVFCYFPADEISISILSNGNNFNTNTVSIALLNAVYGIPFSIPDFQSVEISSEQLEQYTGIYSSTQLPLKITIATDGNKLKAQATGQAAFPLEGFEKDKFRFDAAGIILEIDPLKNTLLLKQGGGAFLFSKE